MEWTLFSVLWLAFCGFLLVMVVSNSLWNSVMFIMKFIEKFMICILDDILNIIQDNTSLHRISVKERLQKRN